MKKSIAISLITAAIAAGSSNISAQQTKVLTAELRQQADKIIRPQEWVLFTRSLS